MVETQNIVIEKDEETIESSNAEIVPMVGFKDAKVVLNTLQMFLRQRSINVMPLIKTLKVVEKKIEILCRTSKL